MHGHYTIFSYFAADDDHWTMLDSVRVRRKHNTVGDLDSTRKWRQLGKEEQEEVEEEEVRCNAQRNHCDVSLGNTDEAVVRTGKVVAERM